MTHLAYRAHGSTRYVLWRPNPCGPFTDEQLERFIDVTIPDEEQRRQVADSLHLVKHASKQVRFETRKITTEHRAQKVAQTPLRPYFVSKSEQVFKKTPKEKFKDVGKAVIEQNKQNVCMHPPTSTSTVCTCM